MSSKAPIKGLKNRALSLPYPTITHTNAPPPI